MTDRTKTICSPIFDLGGIKMSIQIISKPSITIGNIVIIKIKQAVKLSVVCKLLPVVSSEADRRYLESLEKQVLYTEPLWALSVTVSV